jgi:hypothetical protein
MARNQQMDALEFQRMDLPYDRATAPLSNELRFWRGLNMFVSHGGSLKKRLAGVAVADTNHTLRIDRLWIYETEDTPPLVYFVASMYNPVSTYWEIHYFRPGTDTSWNKAEDLRGLIDSTVPHEASPYQGRLYIRAVSATDKYGTALFDGTAGTPAFHYWGLPGPTAPAALVGALDHLDGEINDSTTTVTLLDASNFPSSYPYSITCQFEEMTVSNKTGNVLTVTRGANNTTAVTHFDNTEVAWRDWSASEHRVDVFRQWKYTYAYVTDTGHVTSRAPLETNPDSLPSWTGPFRDLVPEFTLTGHSDTTRVPSINIYRSTDGGGTYFFLEQIANPGSGTFVYFDDSLASGSGATFNDPLPDLELDQAQIAPSLTSNDPPPPIKDGEVGVDNPERGTPIVEYAGRLWYGIGNLVFFSGREEIMEGQPEESFPSGTLNGNFFTFQYPVTNIAGTDDALYIFTLKKVYRLTGTNLETFNPRPMTGSVGAPYGHPRALVQFNEKVAFITHDFRVGIIEDGKYTNLSDALSTDLIDASSGGAEFELIYWSDLEKEYLIVCAHRQGDTTQSRQWVLDLRKTEITEKPFWFVPWDIKAVAAASDRVAEDTAQRRAIFSIWDPDAGVGTLIRLDPTARTAVELEPDGTSTRAINMYAETGLVTCPHGNHVNALRGPALNPVVYNIIMERTKFAGDQDPTLSYYLDDFFTDPVQIPVLRQPSRHPATKGYVTQIGPINKIAHRVAARFDWVESTDLVDIHAFAFTWTPESGSGR